MLDRGPQCLPGNNSHKETASARPQEVQQSGEFGKQNKAGIFTGFSYCQTFSLCLSMLMCPVSPGEGHCGPQSPTLLVLGNVF